MSNIALPTNFATQEASVGILKPAETQVSSSDILAEAHDIKQTTYKKLTSKIQDLEELRSLQLSKRRDYEQQLNKNRLNYGQWMRYAKWEIEHNHDFKRARSIMERALEVNVQHVPFWIRYIELELFHKNINHARNLLSRAITTLPRIDKFWFMYVQTEEALKNYKGVREIFEQWLVWKPSEVAWDSYISFEERYNEYENARAIYIRYALEYPNGSTWQKWILFEKSCVPDEKSVARLRGVFETSVDTLLANTFACDDEIANIISSWIKWEALVGEDERARAILNAVVDRDMLPKNIKLEILRNSSQLKDKIISTSTSTESLSGIDFEKKLKLETVLAEDPKDYDAWWEYAHFQETSVGTKSAMDLLSRAVEGPPDEDWKSTSWRRYVFLWIKWALYTEYVSKDVSGARDIWTNCLQIIPHKQFTFAKIWVGLAEFEIRNLGVDGINSARKVLGKAIGQSCQSTPKAKLFKYYIELEKRLGELDRVRKIYEKWLQSCMISDKQTGKHTWLQVISELIKFEQLNEETDRCIALFELGLSDEFPEDPQMFHNFIKFLKDEFKYDKARRVFRDKVTTGEADIWISFALFESSILSPSQMEELENADTEEVSFQVEDYHLERTRAVFSEAYTFYKSIKDGINANVILDAWLEYENTHGSEENISKVKAKTATKITKRRMLDGVEEICQEYEFPETAPNLGKFLAKAKEWASKS